MGMQCLGRLTSSCIRLKQSSLTVLLLSTVLVRATFFFYMHIQADIELLATKVGAVVSGQTSVKAPERAAFEKHLPADVEIVSCHSLHGPTVNPLGQPLVCTIFPLAPLRLLAYEAKS